MQNRAAALPHHREAGLASGLINTSQQIGGGIGLAILSTVATTRTNHLLAEGTSPPAALTEGFRVAFWVGAGFAVIALAATTILLKRNDLRSEAASGRPRTELEPEEQIAA